MRPMDADQANYVITHAGYFTDEEVKEAIEWEERNA